MKITIMMHTSTSYDLRLEGYLSLVFMHIPGRREGGGGDAFFVHIVHVLVLVCECMCVCVCVCV